MLASHPAGSSRADALEIPLLSIRNVSKTYADGARALEGVNLSLAAGTIAAIFGEPGCGKSTLLRIVAGLELPDGGDVRVARSPIVGAHPHVGFIFQEWRPLPWLTVADNVALGFASHVGEEGEALIANLLAQLSLTDDANRLPGELSDRQQGRVAIARALIAGPKLLLLDEPFSSQDVATGQALRAQLLALCRARRTTVVIATRDVDEAISLADRIVVICPDPGRIAAIVDNAQTRPTQARPRDRLSPEAASARRHALAALDRVMRPALVDSE